MSLKQTKQKKHQTGIVDEGVFDKNKTYKMEVQMEISYDHSNTKTLL